jgi:hypothetical protein
MGVALMGKLPDDEKAPKHIIADYEPCDNCVETFEKGILLIEAVDQPTTEGQPPLGEAYPTGRWAVCGESVLDIFQNIPKDLKAYIVSPEVCEMIGLFDEKKWEKVEEYK